LEERLWESGDAKNVVLRLLEPHTMLAFSATILVKAKDKTKAIFDSIKVDNEFYPENPTKTGITLKKNLLQISIESEELSHLRANINSTLRLIQASSDSIKAVKI
jgi:KEOPS complex subunit Pcc1